MILLDSSVWIDHIRSPEQRVTAALAEGMIAQHPFVTAEIALGSIKNRSRIVGVLNDLPVAPAVEIARLLEFIEAAGLHGTGIGMVDAQLLATASDMMNMAVWTRDKRLHAQAERLGLAYSG